MDVHPIHKAEQVKAYIPSQKRTLSCSTHRGTHLDSEEAGQGALDATGTEATGEGQERHGETGPWRFASDPEIAVPSQVVLLRATCKHAAM